MKRLFDVVVSALGLIVLLPAFVVIAAWIKLDSQGEVLFRQVRVGRFGRTFRINKFRTMVRDADTRGPSITGVADSRITRSGHVLRRTKLDELPQLWNVLVGEMSIVGPRPEVPEYVARYPASDREFVLQVRPGITDEASIRFRNESELLAQAVDPEALYVDVILPQKLAEYRRYVATRTFRGDLRIIGRTIVSVIAG